MTPRHRRYLDATKPRDTREIVVIDGQEIPCEDFKQSFCNPSVRAVDAMPQEWRLLIHEYGYEAHELFEQSVPMFSNQKGMTAAEAKGRLERMRAAAERLQHG